jgi:uncharacterized coiled-coil protein SlyX
MSEWCIEHKMSTDQCEHLHRIRELERQLAAADAIIMGSSHALAAEFKETQTLPDKIHTLVTELAVLNAQNTHMKKVLRLPILFYAAGPVTNEMRKEWAEATAGQSEMTTNVMCDAIRQALGEKMADPPCCGLFAVDGVHSPGCPNHG